MAVPFIVGAAAVAAGIVGEKQELDKQGKVNNEEELNQAGQDNALNKGSSKEFDELMKDESTGLEL